MAREASIEDIRLDLLALMHNAKEVREEGPLRRIVVAQLNMLQLIENLALARK